MKEIKLKIKGMVCKGCENRIKNALQNIDKVKSVVANYEIEEVIIEFKEEIEVSLIKEAIENLGFEIMKEN